MKRTEVFCPHCNGSGRVELSSVYERTLTILRKYGEATGAELARVEGVKATAMNNRLKVLLKYCKVFISRKDGRRVFYEAKP